jgi:hypothetical protein
MVEVKVNNNINLKYDLTDRKTMARIGVEAIGIIRRRTERGVDHKGKKFSGYSTGAYLQKIDMGDMPGGNTAKMRKHYNSQQKWTRKKRKESTARFVWMSGGYKQFREVQGRSTKVNLSFTNLMMKGLKLKWVKDASVLLGFRGEQARKAYYHNISGAGKSKQKRVFQRISRAREIERLRKILDKNIGRELKKS